MIKTDGLYAKTSPKIKRPGEYWGKTLPRKRLGACKVAGRKVSRAGNPTRRQRRERHEIEEALERERRSWFK